MLWNISYLHYVKRVLWGFNWNILQDESMDYKDIKTAVPKLSDTPTYAKYYMYVFYIFMLYYAWSVKIAAYPSQKLGNYFNLKLNVFLFLGKIRNIHCYESVLDIHCVWVGPH